MPARPEVTSNCVPQVETPKAPAQEPPSRRLYQRFESFLQARADNGGLGAPELFAIRDLTILANARLRLQIAVNEQRSLSDEKMLKEGLLEEGQVDALAEYRGLVDQRKIGFKDEGSAKSARERMKALSKRKEIKEIIDIEAKIASFGTEREYAETGYAVLPTLRWSDPQNEARYLATIDAYELIQGDLETAHEEEVEMDLDRAGVTDVTYSLVEIETTRRRVKYLQATKKGLEKTIKNEARNEVDGSIFDIDSFFATMEELSRAVPLESEEETRVKELAIFDIIFYLRAKSRLEEAELKDKLGLDVEQLREMYPGFKPVNDEGNEHSVDARQHRLDQATYPRRTDTVYLRVFDAWSQAQVDLEHQMIFEKSDPESMPEALRAEIDRADAMTDPEESRYAVDTLVSLAATLELQSRFEDVLAAHLRLNSERSRSQRA